MVLSASRNVQRRFARVVAGLCSFAVTFLICGAALAQTQPKWMPSINFEGRWGTKRSIGEGDLFAPLGQNDTTLLFGDARALRR
jgi:hypothetical protein